MPETLTEFCWFSRAKRPELGQKRVRVRQKGCNKRGRLQTQANLNKRAQTQTNAEFRLSENGPKTQITQRAQILKIFKITLQDWNFQARLKRITFSSEIEHFKRATHQTPIFVGNSQAQDWTFQARLKFSSEIENFKRKLEIFKRSSEIGFFQDSGPLGNASKRRQTRTNAKSRNCTPFCAPPLAHPLHLYFLKSIAGTNGSRTAVQIGGVLQ